MQIGDKLAQNSKKKHYSNTLLTSTLPFKNHHFPNLE